MKTQHQSRDGVYYNDRDIARLLAISIGRLRNKLTAGCPLPPQIQPPGCRNRLWPKAAFHAWLEQFLIMSVEKYRAAQPLGRRGRPTKQEARARRS